MKLKLYIKQTIALVACCLAAACEDFVDIDAPTDKIIGKEVFSSEETANSAMTGIYNQLYLSAFSNGSEFSITFLAGLSADNLKNISTTNHTRMEFEQNELFPSNSNNLFIWSSAYNVIYMTNSFVEGLNESEELTEEFKDQVEGEARFIRAFSYFYLVNLYGDVPLVLTTNYSNNKLATRDPKQDIYDQIIDDLQFSIENLPEDYENGERTQVNKYVATALLSRVHLYLENWEMAEDLSTQVLGQSSTYELLGELDDVFLANSKEAIWQISPIGQGSSNTHTNDGNLFIIDPVFSFFAKVKLSEDLLAAFEEHDTRLSNWIGFNQSKNANFAYKYKIRNSNEIPIAEYSMVLRLAEQYLIRAEARAEMGDISGAIEDLDMIRNRAGLELISEVTPEISSEALLNEIIEEKRRELFAEWGHRWLDLKRTDMAGEILGVKKPHWDATDILYPIPEEERIKNPNLTQNPGY